MAGKLNPRQRIFVREYLKDKNASRAYKAAGYPGKGAGQSAAKLLKIADVADAVEKGLAKLLARTEISAERVINRIADVALHSKRARHSDVLKGCELLGKHLNLFVDQGVTVNTLVSVVNEADVKAAREKIKNDC